MCCAPYNKNDKVILQTLKGGQMYQISIKNNKQQRDKFLGELLERNDRDELVQTAINLVSVANIKQIKTQYDRANARTCAAILWWAIGEIKIAKLYIQGAVNELNKSDKARDRLTFLVNSYLDQNIDFGYVRYIFINGGKNA